MLNLSGVSQEAGGAPLRKAQGSDNEDLEEKDPKAEEKHGLRAEVSPSWRVLFQVVTVLQVLGPPKPGGARTAGV